MSDTLAPLMQIGDAGWSVGSPRAMLGFTSTGSACLSGRTLCMNAGPARLTMKGPTPLLAFETISADPFGWGQGIALLVPDPGPIPAPTVIERMADGGLDLGLADGVVRAFFHPEVASDAEHVVGHGFEAMRPILERMSGRWVVYTAVARLEIFSPGGVPALHCLSGSMMRHPPFTPVPKGSVPAAHVFPCHPLTEAGFNPSVHGVFQSLLMRHGRPDLWRIKQSLRTSLEKGESGVTHAGAFNGDRHMRQVIRVALRQWWHETGHPPPEDWTRIHDPAFHRALANL